MREETYIIITVIGNVASGKSTLVDMLGEKLPAEKVPADELYKVNPFFPLALKDRKRWSLASDLWFLYERVKLAKKVPKMLEQSHVVVDSGLLMSWVYSHSRLGSGTMTKDEWELYESVYDELVGGLRRADVVVCLKAPVRALRAGIEKRGRKFEVKFHTEKYLRSLEDSLGVVEQKIVGGGGRVEEFEVNSLDWVDVKQELGVVSSRFSELLVKEAA